MNKKLKIDKETLAGITLYVVCLISILVFIASNL